MAYVFANNVKAELTAGVSAGATSITVGNITSPNNAPPDPGTDTALVTLMDSLTSPTKIEVVSYTGRTDNGDGTYTLSGVSKGQESTADQSWSSGDMVIQALTAKALGDIAGAVSTKSSTYTLSAGDFIHADTSVSAFTVSCPASPSDGDLIGIRDKASSFATNNLTLDGNGKNILGDATFIFDVNDQPAEFEFNVSRNEWIFARR